MSGAEVAGLSVGIIGGTGEQGRGLARRLTLSGQKVIIGSRSAERAALVAAEVGAIGTDNAACAAKADIVIVAIPYEGHRATLESLAGLLAGKIVVDCVNPLGFDGKGAYALAVEEGSAALQAAEVLSGSRVVAAFHHLSSVRLLDEEVASLDVDVLVLGDDRQAVEVVRALAARLPGVRGVYGGRLRNTHQVEALTANLISINRRYRAHAGLRITDI